MAVPCARVSARQSPASDRGRVKNHVNRAAAAMLFSLLLAGCATSGAVRTTAGVPPPMISIFAAGTAVTQPVRSVLGKVRSHSCRYPYSPDYADRDALAKLQHQAAKLGADGLVDVQVVRFSLNGGKNPCWRGSRAVGTAVVFASQTPEPASQAALQPEPDRASTTPARR